jgi:hypothetical protein
MQRHTIRVWPVWVSPLTVDMWNAQLIPSTAQMGYQHPAVLVSQHQPGVQAPLVYWNADGLAAPRIIWRSRRFPDRCRASGCIQSLSLHIMPPQCADIGDRGSRRAFNFVRKPKCTATLFSELASHHPAFRLLKLTQRSPTGLYPFVSCLLTTSTSILDLHGLSSTAQTELVRRI